MIARRGRGGGMQDGMLKHYLEQAAASDTNVEARIEREAFDFRNLMPSDQAVAAKARQLAKTNGVANWHDLLAVAREALIDAPGDQNCDAREIRIAAAIYAVKMREHPRGEKAGEGGAPPAHITPRSGNRLAHLDDWL